MKSAVSRGCQLRLLSSICCSIFLKKKKLKKFLPCMLLLKKKKKNSIVEFGFLLGNGRGNWFLASQIQWLSQSMHIESACIYAEFTGLSFDFSTVSHLASCRRSHALTL